MPTSGVAQIEYFKYSRRFSIWGVGLGTKTINEYTRQNPAGFDKWDAAPGSTQSIADRTNGALNTGLNKQKLDWYFTPFIKVRAGLNINVTQDLFSFVSTTSALDAPAGTSLNSVYLFPATGTNGTSTQKYIAQEKFNFGSAIYYNANHTDFTARNAKWMFNEMENITQPISCIDVCQPGEGGYQISGPELVCTTGIYTISGLPAGIIPTWIFTGSTTIANISDNGLSATITRVGSGSINVVATIPAIANCNPQQVVTKIVKVGPPSVETLNAQYSSGVNAGILLQSQNCMEPYLPGSFQASVNWDDYVGSSYSWTFVDKSPNSTQGVQMALDNKSAIITIRPHDAWAKYRLTVTNTCGSFSKDYRFNASATNCAMIEEIELIVSPNPSSSRITLDLKGAEIISIRIKDKFGNVVKAIKEVKMASRVEVNLSGLKTDIYIVEVFDGKTWFVKKVIKQ